MRIDFVMFEAIEYGCSQNYILNNQPENYGDGRSFRLICHQPGELPGRSERARTSAVSSYGKVACAAERDRYLEAPGWKSIGERRPYPKARAV